jgi:hypothetical protein
MTVASTNHAYCPVDPTVTAWQIRLFSFLLHRIGVCRMRPTVVLGALVCAGR